MHVHGINKTRKKCKGMITVSFRIEVAGGGASQILFDFKLMVVAYLLYVCCEYYFVCFNYLVNFFI